MLKKLLKKLSSSFKLENYKAGELYSMPNQGKFGVFKVPKG